MLTKREIVENKKQILTYLLNIECFRTNKAIEPSEVVRVWRGDDFKGFGHFEWDRLGFSFYWDRSINEIENLEIIDEPSGQDIFAHSFEKLNKKEIERFQDFLI